MSYERLVQKVQTLITSWEEQTANRSFFKKIDLYDEVDAVKFELNFLQPVRTEIVPSSLGRRIAKYGGRINDAGKIEFDSEGEIDDMLINYWKDKSRKNQTLPSTVTLRILKECLNLVLNSPNTQEIVKAIENYGDARAEEATQSENQ